MNPGDSRGGASAPKRQCDRHLHRARHFSATCLDSVRCRSYTGNDTDGGSPCFRRRQRRQSTPWAPRSTSGKGGNESDGVRTPDTDAGLSRAILQAARHPAVRDRALRMRVSVIITLPNMGRAGRTRPGSTLGAEKGAAARKSPFAVSAQINAPISVQGVLVIDSDVRRRSRVVPGGHVPRRKASHSERRRLCAPVAARSRSHAANKRDVIAREGDLQVRWTVFLKTGYRLRLRLRARGEKLACRRVLLLGPVSPKPY
jgi:hypothetical protein